MKQQFDTLAVATRNPAKANNYKNLLAKYAGRVLDLDDLGIHGTAEESGETSEENAQMKAAFYAKQANCVAFSDDASLYVDFLAQDRQPGVHVRRIAGKEAASDAQLLAYWENIVAQAPAAARKGHWHVAFCLAHPDGRMQTFSLDLPIAFFSPSSPVKIPGWPLNSLSGPLGFNKPYSELADWEHREANRRIDLALARTFEEILQ